jgi:hypothetical protein
MSDCKFSIPFQGTSTEVLVKAKTAVEKQGGQFNGDDNSGNFEVSVFGNSIAGSYEVAEQQLHITIHNKPFIIPCNAIESFLAKQLS